MQPAAKVREPHTDSSVVPTAVSVGAAGGAVPRRDLDPTRTLYSYLWLFKRPDSFPTHQNGPIKRDEGRNFNVGTIYHWQRLVCLDVHFRIR